MAAELPDHETSEADPKDHLYTDIQCSCCGNRIAVPVACGDRYCGICTGPRRRRIRSKLEAVVDQVKETNGYTVKFLTLTIPAGPDIRQNFGALVSSFRRLRQSKLWKTKCRGGAYVIEVTGYPGNWHVHLHAIIESQYINSFLLSTAWNKCSPGKIVKIKRIPVQAILAYVTKYMTKSEVSGSHRMEVSEALKSLRLFQPFGTWHSIALKVKKMLYDCPECGYCAWFPADLPDRWNPFLSRGSPVENLLPPPAAVPCASPLGAGPALQKTIFNE